jgi:hypothetical protein
MLMLMQEIFGPKYWWGPKPCAERTSALVEVSLQGEPHPKHSVLEGVPSGTFCTSVVLFHTSREFTFSEVCWVMGQE